MNPALSAALDQHRSGNLEAAAPLYQLALQNEPTRHECLYFFGLLQLQRRAYLEACELIGQASAARPQDGEVAYNFALSLKGANRLEEAVVQYRLAMALRPNDVAARFNLGVALFESGEAEEALEIFDRVLAARPAYAEAHFNRGAVLLKLDRAIEAMAAFEAALQIDPKQAKTHNNLGIALQRLNRHAQAFLAFEAAVTCDPSYAAAHANLSATMREMDRLPEAVEAARAAVAADPKFAAGHYNLGTALFVRGDYRNAAEALAAAVALEPSFADAQNNLGNALAELGRIDEAIRAYRASVELQPEDAKAWSNLGSALIKARDLTRAIAALETAIRIRPDFAEAHADLGNCLLMAGDFTRGWAEFEWRLSVPAYASTFPVLPKKRWDGAPGSGGRLLIYAEGGIGDVVQLLPLVARAKARGWTTVLAARPHMMSLFTDTPGVDEVVNQNKPLPGYDAFVAMESLPAMLDVTLENLPNKTPFLFPKADRVAAWGDKLADLAKGKKLKVGLVWAGNPTWRLDRFRSPGLAPMLPLLDAPDTAFFALQVGPGRAKIKEYGVESLLCDLADDLTDLAETAAAMSHLDLVVSSCTGPAHMAAALARPTWVALNYDACWRWMLDRDDSPWYPTMRLFRQTRRGDWDTPFAAIREALVAFKG